MINVGVTGWAIRVYVYMFCTGLSVSKHFNKCHDSITMNEFINVNFNTLVTGSRFENYSLLIPTMLLSFDQGRSLVWYKDDFLRKACHMTLLRTTIVFLMVLNHPLWIHKFFKTQNHFCSNIFQVAGISCLLYERKAISLYIRSLFLLQCTIQHYTM